MSKKLSIIVPVYNVSQYLNALLESLVNQTYKEKSIILVDDGSTDDSGIICDKYAAKFTFVKTIHTLNQGISNARNKGIDEADGDYIAFSDADDVLDLDFFQILINAMEETKSDVSACGFMNEYKKNIPVIKNHENIPSPIVITGREKCLMSISGEENNKVCFAGFVWNKVYKSEILKEVKFHTEFMMLEDLLFSYEIMSKCDKICFVDLPMYHYRYNTSSISKQGSHEKCKTCLDSLDYIKKWIEKNAPFCRKGVCANYIFWQTKVCELMIRNVDFTLYERVKNNLVECKEYIPLCSKRIQLLANALTSSWFKYKIFGEAFLMMKKMYVLIKKYLFR